MRDHQDKDTPYAADFMAVVRAFQDDFVISGCETTPGSGSFEVDVATGEIHVGLFGSVDVDPQTTDHSPGPAEDRVDLITAGTDGTVRAVQGTEADPGETPVAPDIPQDEVLLAIVEVPGGSTDLTADDILDARVISQT